MMRNDLEGAIAGMVRALKQHPSACSDLTDGLLILTESLVEVARVIPSRKQARIERLAFLERRMHDSSPAQRMSAAMDDLGIQRSYYYEIRAAAIEQKLIEE